MPSYLHTGSWFHFFSSWLTPLCWSLSSSSLSLPMSSPFFWYQHNPWPDPRSLHPELQIYLSCKEWPCPLDPTGKTQHIQMQTNLLHPPGFPHRVCSRWLYTLESRVSPGFLPFSSLLQPLLRTFPSSLHPKSHTDTSTLRIPWTSGSCWNQFPAPHGAHNRL